MEKIGWNGYKIRDEQSFFFFNYVKLEYKQVIAILISENLI